MPKLLLFAPCQKLILSQEDNSASLISVMAGVNAVIPESGASIPEGTHIPFAWYAIALWSRRSDEHGANYKQKISLIASDGAVLSETEQVFEMKRASHRVYASFPTFPIWKSGTCELKLFLRSGERDWEEIFSFPMEVRHVSPEQAAAEHEEALKRFVLSS